MRSSTTRTHSRSQVSLALLAVLASGGLVLSSCSNTDPLADDPDTSADAENATDDSTGGEGSPGPDQGNGEVAEDAIVVGSQAYYSNEIIAELYAQALEAQGFSVDRQYQIGQREVYLPELESGAIDVLPEYTGNLLQYYDEESTASSPDEVFAALDDVLPEDLRVLQFAEATDQDSYSVTQELAEEYDLVSIGDLATLDGPVSIAANSEFQVRPYGPDGAQSVYGVELVLTPVEDSGGPLTVNALLDGTVQVADIYTASPAVGQNNLVILEDPENLILPQNVVPVTSADLDADAAAVIEDVQELLTLEDLIELNTRSVEDQSPSAEIAERWLTDQGLL